MICILIYVDYNETTEIVPPEKAAVSEDATTPTYAYYIIGIGSAVLLIALTLVVCCCVYTSYVKCVNNRRNKLPPSVKDPWGPLYSVSIVTHYHYF